MIALKKGCRGYCMLYAREAHAHNIQYPSDLFSVESSMNLQVQIHIFHQ